jgi:SagB-type dehydrogenase family enzyme
VEIDRREFFRAAMAGLVLFLGGPARAANEETAVAIHRATRNTLRGAVGARLRAYRRALGRFKAYPGLPRVALPEPVFEGGRAVLEAVGAYAPAPGFAPDAALTREELARLLFLANGVTDSSGRIGLRAAPSAGALYAGEVYAVVERVTGMAAGVYAYHAGRHDLVQLRTGRLLAEVAPALAQPRAAAGAAAAVLLTNVFGRYSTRYANRGYRYALIDSGHIGENLRLAAWELGLAEAAPLRFEDDRLNELLGVDGREEAVCAVHLLGRSGPKPPGAPTNGVRPLVERQSQEELPAALSAPARFHEATKLVAGSGKAIEAPRIHEGAAASLHSKPQRRAPQSEALTPSDEVAADMAVHAAIRVRRSATHFEAEAMPRRALLQILALARGHAGLHRSEGLDLYCVANRVTETERGLYRYEPANHRLEPRRRGDLAARLVRACLGQEKSGQAAAALVGVARLSEASARGGARAYRDLLLDAGATAQRVYLGAEALGFAARNLAAFYDDELDVLLGLDGEREVAIHLTALGPGT